MPVGLEPILLNRYFNDEPYTQIVNPRNFTPQKHKKILITQYFKVNTEDKVYNNERQKEIDACLEINAGNTQLDEIHLLSETDYDLSFISKKLVGKIRQTVIGKRLDYKTAFDYYNTHLSGVICVLSNADTFTDESLEILDHMNLENTILALTRYEYNDEKKPSLLYGSEERSRAPNMYKDYEPIVGSQDAWVWKMQKIEILNSDFCLGVHGCDNKIATLIVDSGYNIYNPCHLISISHYDRLGTKVINGDKRKGLISLKRDPPPSDSYLYKTFVKNTSEIVDRYTKTVTYKNQITCTKPYWQPKYYIDISTQKSISEIHYSENTKSTEEQLYKEYNFNNICTIYAIDFTGNSQSKIAYVSKFRISYFHNNVWQDYNDIFNGPQKAYDRFIKRNYISIPFACNKIRIYILAYVTNPELNVRFYGKHYNTIKDRTIFLTLTNTGYIDYTLNCLESLKNIRFDKPLISYCIGQRGAEVIKNKGHDVLLIEDEEDNSQFQSFRSGKWSNVVYNKFKIIYANLLKYDYVCYTDGDIVFVDRSWFDYLIKNLENNDILIQDNSHAGYTDVCSGFMFIKASETSIELFNPIHVEKYKDKVGWGDQIYINEIIGKLKYKRLPLDLFPNGGFYYDNCENISPYIIHFNWIKGHEKKEKLKHHKKWYLKP